MNSLRRLVVLVALLAAGAAVAAEPPVFQRPDGRRVTAGEVDAIVAGLMKGAEVPGLALALIDRGELRYVRTYGTRNKATGTPLQPDTIMYGASLTKGVFAYYCMKLVDAGLLDLDRPIGEYLKRPLPEYDGYRDLAGDPRWNLFTPRMLLSHTSGMPNFRWINADEKLDIKFQPGSRYAYSGEGLNMLQFVLEEGLGIDVGADMERRVFRPLGMTRTSMTWRPGFASNNASGHDETGKPVGHNVRKNVRAAGSMDTTIEDFARFTRALVRGEGLSATSRRELTREQVRIRSATQFPTTDAATTTENDSIRLGYGLGWGRFRTPWGPAFFKEGGGSGATNYVLCIERKRTCLVALTNSDRGRTLFLYLADRILGRTNLPWKWEGYVPYDAARPAPAP